MNCDKNDKNKLLVILLVAVLFTVLVTILFDWGLMFKALMGTLILALVCIVRAMMNADTLADEMDIDKPTGIASSEPATSDDRATLADDGEPDSVQQASEERQQQDDTTTNQ